MYDISGGRYNELCGGEEISITKGWLEETNPLPEWHFVSSDWMTSIKHLSDLKEHDTFYVSNQYLRKNAHQIKTKSRKGNKGKGKNNKK